MLNRIFMYFLYMKCMWSELLRNMTNYGRILVDLHNFISKHLYENVDIIQCVQSILVSGHLTSSCAM